MCIYLCFFCLTVYTRKLTTHTHTHTSARACIHIRDETDYSSYNLALVWNKSTLKYLINMRELSLARKGLSLAFQIIWNFLMLKILTIQVYIACVELRSSSLTCNARRICCNALAEGRSAHMMASFIYYYPTYFFN